MAMVASPETRQLLAFLPTLKGTKSDRKTQAYRDRKRWVFNECMRCLLQPLQRFSKGVMATMQGQTLRCKSQCAQKFFSILRDSAQVIPFPRHGRGGYAGSVGVLRHGRLCEHGQPVSTLPCAARTVARSARAVRPTHSRGYARPSGRRRRRRAPVGQHSQYGGIIAIPGWLRLLHKHFSPAWTGPAACPAGRDVRYRIHSSDPACSRAWRGVICTRAGQPVCDRADPPCLGVNRRSRRRRARSLHGRCMEDDHARECAIHYVVLVLTPGCSVLRVYV